MANIVDNGEKMNKIAILIAGFMLMSAWAAPAGANPELLEVAKDKLKEKVLQSGTLDIYDEDINKVRNLRMIGVTNVVEEGAAYVVSADYRDINSGDIVNVEAGMVSAEEDFVVGAVEIKGVQAMDDGGSGEAKEYTDGEVRDFMKDYIKKQGQFNDGKVMLFDKDNERMRNLTLTELKEEVRRMGIFYSSSAKFTDANTGDILDVDISVENKDGNLKVQALRIRGVRKGPVGIDVSQ